MNINHDSVSFVHKGNAKQNKGIQLTVKLLCLVVCHYGKFEHFKGTRMKLCDNKEKHTDILFHQQSSTRRCNVGVHHLQEIMSGINV